MRDDRPAHQGMKAWTPLVLAGPLLWALLVLFHPMPAGDSAYGGVKDEVDRWIFVHLGQLVLTPFLFLAVWRLLDGLSSKAATISRSALVVWTVFFSAYDAVQGVATGVLTSHANGLPATEQAGFAAAIDYLVEDSTLAGNVSVLALVGAAAWITVAIAAAVALHRAGARTAIVAAACLSAVFALHVVPAAIGLLALFVAGLLRARHGTDAILTPAEPPAWGRA